MAGRRFGSAKPVRCGDPSDFVRPTKSAKVPSSDEVMSILEQPGAPAPPVTRFRFTLATTTLRTITSTRAVLPPGSLRSCPPGVTLISIAFSAASRPSDGAVPSTRPPSAGNVRMASHGTDAVRLTGAWEISGAVTLPT